MTSYESDEQFIDNMAQEYLDNETYQMSDEEQQGFEEHITDEEIEACDDPLINNLFDSYSGDKTSETNRVENIKKAKSSPPVPRGVVSAQEIFAQRLANKFNHQGVK